jgi:hypothetical protein
LEQPKKPGPGRDIADLKARLGLARGGPAAPSAAPAPFPGPGMPGPGPGMPGIPMVPPPSAVPNPLAPFPSPVAPTVAPVALPPPSAAPAFDDPFAAMRPPEGKHFDLRNTDDGRPTVSVQQRGGLAGKVILVIAVAVAGAVGFGFGASAVGRRNFNATNDAAKKVKKELDEMQTIISQIGSHVAMSQQRLASEKKDPLSYDPKLITDLEMVKLDPRPDTSRIFKLNYFGLPDVAVDRLMTYYYDTINLFGEVERHIKRTKADKATLESFSAKLAEKGGTDPSKPAVNYGVVFSSSGKLAIGNLVEMGKQVCKGGGDSCGAADLEGFQIRSNTGAPWTSRKIGPKPEGDKVVPIERTPLFDAVMSGSPDQVRMEQYKQRYNSMRQILARLGSTRKELGDAIEKAAARPDLFSF